MTKKKRKIAPNKKAIRSDEDINLDSELDQLIKKNWDNTPAQTLFHHKHSRE